VVSVLPQGGDLRRVENWRPISLLCSDYKILSKLLANRLKSVIGTVVHADQSYCIPGRSISDNIFFFRDLIDCGLKEDGVGLLFLDIEKAFDSVDHTYMFHVLQKFGFGEKFICFVKLLYNNISNLCKVNNFLCSPFQVQRGVRQGCPLSGLLFSLLLEPLLINLRLSLSGFVPSPEEHHIIVSAYADDICVIIRNDQDLTTLLESLRMFHRTSSLKVNWQKSKALWVSSVTRTSGRPPLAPPHSLPKGLSWEREGVKYLGVYLGPYQYSLMNWEGTVDDVTKRL